MGDLTGIQWTATPMPNGDLYPGATFNGWIGCEKVSPECDHCYAESGSKRLGAQHGLKLWDGDRYFTSEDYWKKPLAWDRAAARAGTRKKVFCASFSDVFEDRADLVERRARLCALIERTPNLDWLLLTKRPHLIRKLAPASWDYQTPPNVWLGTTCGLQSSLPRVADLVGAPLAAVKFVSVEPQIEEVSFDGWMLGPGGVNWVICGGESGNKSRPFDIAWARKLQAQCAAKGAAFFMKQLGAKPLDSDGAPIELADSHGGTMDEWPEGAPRVREFPRLQEAA